MVRIIVVAVVEDTPHTEEFTADWAPYRLFPDGRLNIRFVNGKDEQGRAVDCKSYRRCEMVTRIIE